MEVILTLFAYKCLHPQESHACLLLFFQIRLLTEIIPTHFQGMFLTRGNHETAAMNKMYGFDGEVKAKYNVKLADLFQEVFCYLPLV